MAKLTRPQIFIIGGVTALVIGLLGYFLLIDPSYKQLAIEQDRYDKRKAVADKKRAVDASEKDAEDTVKEAVRDWQAYETRFMPNIDVSNTYSAWQDLINERTYILGPLVDRHLKRDKSVTVLDWDVKIDPPPSDPNEALRDINLYQGSIQVMGTFKNVLAHVEKWNNFDRLALVSNLNLRGSSPNLVATYNLSIIEYSNGDLGKAVAIPQASGGNTGGTNLQISGGSGSMMQGPGMRGASGPQMGGMAGAGAPGGGAGGVKGGD